MGVFTSGMCMCMYYCVCLYSVFTCGICMRMYFCVSVSMGVFKCGMCMRMRMRMRMRMYYVRNSLLSGGP